MIPFANWSTFDVFERCCVEEAAPKTPAVEASSCIIGAAARRTSVAQHLPRTKDQYEGLLRLLSSIALSMLCKQWVLTCRCVM